MTSLRSSLPPRSQTSGAFARTLGPFLVLVAIGALAACGEGRWGAKLTLTLSTTDASDVAMGPGHTLHLPSGHRVILDRLCLGLDTLVISPAPSEGGEAEPQDTCFCHGDPPHCHGDCAPGAAGEAPPIIRTLQVGLDLLGGATEVITAGAAPGRYDTVTLSLGPPAEGSLPAGCPALGSSAFTLEGELFEPGATEGQPLVIDLRVTDRITEALRAEMPAEATSAGGGMTLRLRPDAVLGAVDWARVRPGPGDEVTIGGPASANIIAVGELLSGLTSASSWTVSPRMTP